jgi:hypothetical protein
MPEEQFSEFNRYIGLMNAVNRALGLYLLHLKGEVEKLSRDAVWLATVLLWQAQAFELGAYIMSATTEPVTESAYKEIAAAKAEEYVPVSLLAYVLTEHYHDWTEDELAPESAHDDVIVRGDAWRRVQAGKAKEIAALVANGTLVGKGKAKALTVQAGSFYGGLGEPVPVFPEWACAYDVRPDAEAEDVAARRAWREDVRKAYREGPTRFVAHVEGLARDPQLQPEETSQINEVVTVQKARFKESVLSVWRQLRAIDVLVDEVAEAFGEDPCVPAVREVLDNNKERVMELHKDAQRYAGEFALEEPGDEQVDEIRTLTERELL